MNFLSQMAKNFSELQWRERILAVSVGCIVLALGGNLVLLKPLQLEIDRLRALDNTHKTDLASAMRDLADADGKLLRGVDPLAKERTVRDELLNNIAEADAFFSSKDATAPHVGSLVRNLLADSPGLSLVSIKTLPAQVFYTPPKPPPPKATDKVAQNLSSLLPPAAQSAPVAKPVGFQKTLYKHGVEVTVKGKYAQLVTYLEQLQKYPKRVFWSEAKLSVSPYPATALKFVVYTLSDEPVAPLN
jgi:MSHA biogenesis protein MshJ